MGCAPPDLYIDRKLRCSGLHWYTKEILKSGSWAYKSVLKLTVLRRPIFGIIVPNAFMVRLEGTDVPNRPN